MKQSMNQWERNKQRRQAAQRDLQEFCSWYHAGEGLKVQRSLSPRRALTLLRDSDVMSLLNGSDLSRFQRAAKELA